MPKGFQKGNKGKPVGAVGKKTAQWEALAESITGEQAEKFSSYMAELWDGGKDQKREAAELYLKTVEYFKPKQSRVDNQISGALGVNNIKFEDA